MIQLQIDCYPRDKIDALSETLDETEALSVTFSDQHDHPILEPELGTTPLWPHLVIQALYSNQQAADTAIKHLLLHHPDLTCSLKNIPDKDWQRACMDEFKPLKFGQKLWVCPSWETPPEVDAVNIILDPGLAFGTGTHPTTHLCLTWLEQAELNKKTIIDYGCGSGILALAALKLGAAHATALDIDNQALIATQNNADVNKITSAHAEPTSTNLFAESMDPPSKNTLTIATTDCVIAPADVVIANLLLAPLIQLKTRFYQLLNPNGILAVSGILENQAESLIEVYRDTFVFKNSFTREGWAILLFTPLPKNP